MHGEATPSSLHQRRHNTESSSLPVISPSSFGEEQDARGCSRRWEEFSDSTGELPPPQSGQPPDSKVLPRHNLFASLGAWSLDKIDRQVVKPSTRQTSKTTEEDSSSSNRKLEREDHVYWIQRRPAGHGRPSEDRRHRHRTPSSLCRRRCLAGDQAGSEPKPRSGTLPSGRSSSLTMLPWQRTRKKHSRG